MLWLVGDQAANSADITQLWASFLSRRFKFCRPKVTLHAFLGLFLSGFDLMFASGANEGVLIFVM